MDLERNSSIDYPLLQLKMFQSMMWVFIFCSSLTTTFDLQEPLTQPLLCAVGMTAVIRCRWPFLVLFVCGSGS